MHPNDSAGSQMPEEARIALRKTFVDQDVDELVALLPTREELPSCGEYHRVIFSIIRQSRGDVIRLVHYSNAARRDWRDVLYWEESPADEDAPQGWAELSKLLGIDQDRGDKDS